MARARRTRAEQQAETRAELLIAARKVFLERGYSAASIEEITAEAGYSRGAVYSNFASKEDLFFAADDDLFEAYLGSLLRRLQPADTLEAKLAAARQWLEDDYQRYATWKVTSLEFQLVTRGEPAVTERLRQRRAALLELLAHEIDSQTTAMGIGLALPTSQIAETIVWLFDGASAAEAIGAAPTPDALMAVLTQLLEPRR